MSFKQILEQYRKKALSERDKGERFEILMQAFLKTYPVYADELAEVWLWNDFPFRKDFGGKDLGIDLVAKTVNNEYWAIQCKCYTEAARIDKPAVDSFLSTSSKSFINELGQSLSFERRIWIATTDHWNREAEVTLQNQQPPVTRIGLADLLNAPVDWDKLIEGKSGKTARIKGKTPREHQEEAIANAHEYFKTRDRGKFVMACGTGKTYTALNVVEQETKKNGFALFLVPSIALLNQTLREWMNDTTGTIYPVCICSDSRSSQVNGVDADDMSTVDLPYPATTDVNYAVMQLKKRQIQQSKKDGMVIIFSTYQSIEVVHKIQKKLSHEGESVEFDIIVCDEAHRTTGVTLKGNGESNFVKVHDNDFLKANHRLYMTATPRLYTEEAKKKAAQGYAELCSMDDKELYGEEIYRIGFGEAVEKGLLSDYKVIVLTISEDQIPVNLQRAIAKNETEISTDSASKLIGCINALSKCMTGESAELKEVDPNFMHTALAFCSSIRKSQMITAIFNEYADEYYKSLTTEERDKIVHVESRHVDGSMNALQRQEKLEWLKETTNTGKECHILTNVRCLSEGVDVPSLDAVIFLSSRNSQVDVVQSVGRVMRRSPKDSGYDKKYGYIIIPVVVPPNVEPEVSLESSPDFAIVWSVLNALRAHDDRFNAMVNKIELNKNKSTQVLVGGTPNNDGSAYDGGNGNAQGDGTEGTPHQTSLYFSELQGAIYARMVKKVGTKRYWEQWAGDVAEIARRHKDRILQLIQDGDKHQKAFEDFIHGLHVNINPYITQKDAIEMLSQHLITQPVFEALFENYSFVKNNPISQSMNKILALLDEQAMDKDREKLGKFYAAIRRGCEGVNSAEGKQKIVIELYDKFFKLALPKTVEKLGIVYTPVQVVDFILRSVNDVLRKEFNRRLTDENIHILDPFTGTGTFIVRLLQLGLIKPEDLVRKYTKELHANEIVLLAYYIASINIENAYHDVVQQEGYTPFEGICLTDTFQLGEKDGSEGWFSETFPVNSERVIHQQQAPLRVIVGNPPYSVGQKSANDNAQNESYQNLDKRIAETYVANTNANNKNRIYDSYIKAFRWATDRLNKEGGIIAFVSNVGWLEGAAMDGFRACLENEFTSVYVFNLRGNQRTSGEASRREGGKIFGSGSRTPIAITVLVRNSKMNKPKADIFYHDIGDYLSREEKLNIIEKFGSVNNSKFGWKVLHPNEHNDWLNQRSEVFTEFIPMEPDKKYNTKSQTMFVVNSLGECTNRDTWAYNFSEAIVAENMKNTIMVYNKSVQNYNNALQKNPTINFKDFQNMDSKLISWSSSLSSHFQRGEFIKYENKILTAYYRPFTKEYLYWGEKMIHRRGQMDDLFPTPEQENLLICVSGIGGSKEATTIITDKIIDLNSLHSGTQCFPLYYYEEVDDIAQSLFESNQIKYKRCDGITDFALKQAHELYGKAVTKKDIFYYVYGFLHLPKYRMQFAADLKKSLPRIMFVDEPKSFWKISKAGQELAELHLHYETQPAPEGVVIEGDAGDYTVTKLKFPQKDQRDMIRYNDEITIKNIPERVYDYVVNGRSPVEWIFDRYQVTVDKYSGIKNDPNDWAKEHEKTRYTLDLLLSVMTVSLKTLDIIESLPDVKFE